MIRVGLTLCCILTMAPAATAAVPVPVPVAAAPVWHWSDTPDLFPYVPGSLPVGADHLILSSSVDGKDRAGPVLMHLEHANGAVAWSVDAASDMPTYREGAIIGGAIAVAGGRVFLARYMRAASGCRLSAWSATDGKLLWSVFLEGIGPIGHSMYSNRVQLTVTAAGDPLVFGLEAGGRYIEQRDATTGAQVNNQKLGSGAMAETTVEAVYAELANMLRRGPHYNVSLTSFVTRHVYDKRVPDQAARLALARQAVAQLEGLPVYGSKHHMHVSFTEKAGDVIFHATR